MIRLWLMFIGLALLIHFGIQAWQKLNNSERWSLTKTGFYSIIIALLTTIAMTAIVVIF